LKQLQGVGGCHENSRLDIISDASRINHYNVLGLYELGIVNQNAARAHSGNVQGKSQVSFSAEPGENLSPVGETTIQDHRRLPPIGGVNSTEIAFANSTILGSWLYL
jgi:hypothetical protein